MGLTILAITCTESAEFKALPTDCFRISSLRLTMSCCPTRETLILGGGFRNRRRPSLDGRSAAKFLGVSPQTAYVWVEQHKIE